MPPLSSTSSMEIHLLAIKNIHSPWHSLLFGVYSRKSQTMYTKTYVQGFSLFKRIKVVANINAPTISVHNINLFCVCVCI